MNKDNSSLQNKKITDILNILQSEKGGFCYGDNEYA